ncbi:PsbP-related protein [Methanobrevibacter sp.]|uniref:PsbP-related protein n=1 Tax=Methanobrevibacter sp. TaxID=66852 RepID=UPI00386D664E
MKKCPECGNPSYDGAPICGNCGYTFPKPKVAPPKREDIFQEKPRLEKKTDDNKGILTILKEKKLVIGIILIITLIVICGIVLMGSHSNDNAGNSNPVIQSNDLVEYKEGDFSFKYPNTWEKVNGSDEEHPDAVFFQNEENVTIEYYNITSSANSLKDITQQRISHAQEGGDYVELVETITLDGRNSSNMLLENADGDYTRYVSMFSDGKLYVFKVTGSSEKSITSEDIENAIKTADIA